MERHNRRGTNEELSFSLICVISCIIVTCHAQIGPTLSTWSYNQQSSGTTTVGRLASAALIGHNTYLFGGLTSDTPFANTTTLLEYLSEINTSASIINYVNLQTSNLGVPLTLPPTRFPPPWKHIPKPITNNASNWIPATLPFPVAGPNNVVVIGATAYSLAMCNVVPMGVAVNESDEREREYLLSGWAMDVVVEGGLLDTNHSNSTNNGTSHNTTSNTFATKREGDTLQNTPKVQVRSFQLPPTSTPRFNASCVAHGASIWVIGGVFLPSTAALSVGMFNTITGDYSNQIWSLTEGVSNPALASDDAFIYIAGGLDPNGSPTQVVSAHHVTTTQTVALEGYPATPYELPFVAVANGNIIVTGYPYFQVATYSVREQGSFPVSNTLPPQNLVGGALVGASNDRNVTLGLFGGLVPSVGVSGIYNEATVEFGEGLWAPTTANSVGVKGVRYFTSPNQSPSWIPNNNFNVTVFSDGYEVMWHNMSFSLLFDNASLRTACNVTAEECVIRIARSSRCDDPYVEDVVVSDATTRFMRLSNQPLVAVGPFQPIIISDPDSGNSRSGADSSASGSGSGGPPTLWDHRIESNEASQSDQNITYGAPQYAMVCVSVGQFSMQPCTNTKCPGYFYTPVNQLTPYIVAPMPTPVAPTTQAPSSPSPTTIAPTPVPTAPAAGPSTRLSVFVGVGSSVVVLLLITAFFVWRRSNHSGRFEEADDDGDDYDDPESSLLNNGRKPNRKLSGTGRGASPGSPQAQIPGQPALLDGKYRVVQRLGKGSFSVVYLVERPADGQKFALKYVQISDDTDRHEAMKECEVVHKLQGHPNVIQLYDMFMSYRFDSNLGDGSSGSSPGGFSTGSRGGPNRSSSPRYFDTNNFAVRIDDENQVPKPVNRQASGERYLSLVMEYHEKGDLGRYVKRLKGDPRIPEATILSIAFQVLSVLNYMHHGTPPIIHRDLKPENILLSSVIYENMSGSFLPIVVTDFGLSRVMDKTFCETGVGSLPYVAPECWQRCYSTKVDIWAVGCILYAVCAKRVEPDNVRVMFSESARPDFHKKLFTELHNVYGYSEGCAKFIISLLDVDPERRPTAAAALKRLKKRRASQSLPMGSIKREVSDLDVKPSGDAGYRTEELGADAQCEFYVPSETVFSPLSSGWNYTAGTYVDRSNTAGLTKSGSIRRPPAQQPPAADTNTSSSGNNNTTTTTSSSQGRREGALNADSSSGQIRSTITSSGPVVPPTSTVDSDDKCYDQEGSLSAVTSMRVLPNQLEDSPSGATE